ncbi:MAG: biosynthetic-type acetolactate synthase large subunit, partial [Candidatus Margulisiibacteriota bacterium]
NYPKEVDLPSYKPNYIGNPRQIKAAAEMISKAERPIIIAGGGIILSNASQELRDLVAKTNIPVGSTLMGLGAYPADDFLALGMVGMHGAAYANYTLAESDLIIAIGMRFSDRVTGKLSTFVPHAKIIHIDIDPAEISKCVPATIPIVGDVKNVLTELIPLVKAPNIKPWLEKVKVWKEQYPLAYKKDGGSIAPQYVLQEINRLTKGDCIITTEVGEHQMWAAQYMLHKNPRSFISSGGLGTMGFGFPAAIGAQVGCPDKLVVDIAGDGSIQMNIQELGTVKRYNIPVKVCIMNNGYLGMVRQWQELFYGKRYSQTDLCAGGNPDFVKVAEAYGVLGLRATKPEEVGKVLEQAFNHKGPVFMDMVVEPEASVYPMVPAGGIINKMILNEERKGETYS